MTTLYLAIFAISVLLSFFLTREVRGFAVARGWLAPAFDDRHVHPRPLPRLGGVAIYSAFLISTFLAFLASFVLPQIRSAVSFSILTTILGPATLVFWLGVYDDLRSIGPYPKFAVQAIAASLLFAAGLRIVDIPVLFGARQFGWAASLGMTIFWVIGITNAFNLIDGLDGLAAGSGLFSTLVVFVVAVTSHSPLVSLLTVSLAGAILGFLRFNFNPATIFLGDCGSLFIGFMLSALALAGAQKAPTVIAVAIPVVSFGLPILETTLSVLRRLISGRPIFTADREHIHHKLLQRGLSHRQVVIVLYAVSALFALLSLFLLWPSGSTLGLVLAVLGTGIWYGVQHLGYLEFGELARVAQRTLEQRSIFVNNLAIRRATEDLKAARDYPQVRRILDAAFCNNDFDGFELKVMPAGPSRSRHGGQEDCFRWTKPEFGRHAQEWSTWHMELELVTTANRARGHLTIYRFYSDRPLLLDINLLTSVFPVALAEALDRVLTPARCQDDPAPAYVVAAPATRGPRMKIVHVVGARPNFMKASSVMRALDPHAQQVLIHTGQHYDANMSDVFFEQLDLPAPDINLGAGSGTHAQQTAMVMARFEPVVRDHKPDLVVVYGDVNSTLATALVCSKLNLPLAHVEAGLRSWDRTMPEEINRILSDQIAEFLFTPSADADSNLLREGVAEGKIHRVGNVMIDTLVRLLPQSESFEPAGLPDQYALLTLHRPSNVDDLPYLLELLSVLRQLRVPVIFPVHPRTRKRIASFAEELEADNFQVLDPLPYREFLALQRRATVVITDSGGIQEETTFLNVPCLTVRENTERPVTVSLGTNILVGRDTMRLRDEIKAILNGDGKRAQPVPLWDGHAAERIASVLLRQVFAASAEHSAFFPQPESMPSLLSSNSGIYVHDSLS